MKNSFPFRYLLMILCFFVCTSFVNEFDTDKTGKLQDFEQVVPPPGRYEIKSGVYITKSKSAQMPADMPMESYNITYFDDYGNKELLENVMKMDMGTQKMETHNFNLIKDNISYSWKMGDRQGTKYNISAAGKDMNYAALSEEMRKQYNYKELGTEMILGKECKKISLDIPQSGGTATVSTWKGINMRMEMNISGMPITTEVTDLKEDVTIEASKFEIPADVIFTEMKIPGK